EPGGCSPDAKRTARAFALLPAARAAIMLRPLLWAVALLRSWVANRLRARFVVARAASCSALPMIRVTDGVRLTGTQATSLALERLPMPSHGASRGRSILIARASERSVQSSALVPVMMRT